MADEQIIFDISVDTDDINQATKRVDELYDSIEELTNLIKSARKQNAEYKKTQQELNEAYEAGTISTEQYEKSVNELNDKIKENNKLISETSTKLSEQKREQKAVEKLLTSEIGTLENLKAKRALLNKEINETNILTEEGRKRYKDLEKQLEKVNSDINEASKGFGNYKENIGRYTESIDAAKISQGALLDDLEDMPGATGAAAGGVKSLGAQFNKLLKNPIVLLIAAIVAGLAMLFQAFRKSATGSRVMEKAMAGLDGIMSALVKLVEPLAQFLNRMFTEPQAALEDLGKKLKENLINRLLGILEFYKAIGKGIKSLVTLNFDELAEAAGDAGQAIIQAGSGFDKEQQKAIANELAETAKRAQEYAKAMIALNEAQVAAQKRIQGLELALAGTNKQLAIQEQIANDDTLSMQAMLEAAKKVSDFQRDAAAQEQAIANQRVSIIEQELSIRRAAGEDTRGLIEQLTAAKVAAVDAETRAEVAKMESFTLQRKIERDIFEQNLDILIDVGDKIKTEREKQITDETKSLDERKALLEANRAALTANFNQISKEYERYGVTAEQINAIVAQSDAEVTNEMLKNLNISEIGVNRLREIIMERKAAELDHADLQKDLTAEEKKRNEEAVASINETETEKTKLELENQIKRAEQLKKSDAEILALQRKLTDELIKFEEEKRDKLLENQTLTAKEREAITAETGLKILELEQEYLDKTLAMQAGGNEAKIGLLTDMLEQTGQIVSEFGAEYAIAFNGISQSIVKMFEDGKVTAENALGAIGATANAVFSLMSSNRQEELTDLQKQKEAELALTEGNEAAQLAITEEYKKKEKQIKLKQFNADKAAAIVKIGIETAQAVMKSVAASPLTLGMPWSAIIGGIGLAQAAIVAAKKPPEFGYGTSDIVNIGDSHASGNDVSVFGVTKSGQRQFFGKVERGEAMPVIRKSAVNDYQIAKLNGRFQGVAQNRTFAEGTPDITNMPQSQSIDINALAKAMQSYQPVVKVEDITTQQNRKVQVRNNATV
jgi:predicted  nucleic acid-binding Zn-ribbon protein